MVTRLFNENDINVINSWCKLRNLNELQEDQITSCGVVVTNEEAPVCVMWLYPVMNSKVCFIDNLITSPETSSEQRDEALNLLFSTTHEIAKELGYKYIKVVTSLEKLKTRLVRYGYSQDLSSYSHFTGVL